MKNIYPIYLYPFEAASLVNKHARNEFDEKTSFHGRSYKYNHDAKILENGDVEVWVGYSFDDGFASGSGSVFKKTIRPFNEDQLKVFKTREVLRIATEEYERQETMKKDVAILELAKNMYPDDIEVKE